MSNNNKLMHKALRISAYIAASFMLIIGAAVFGYGMIVPAFVAESFLIFGALFFIGGIVVIYGAKRSAPKEVTKPIWDHTK